MDREATAAVSVDRFRELATGISAEIGKVIVGQSELIHDLLVALLAGGNALLEGVPGLGKTLLIRTLAQAIDCSFGRIQFTPDLMPADIVGTMIITESADGHRGFRFEKGPIFANLILADEVNRATPRTQSALLEAMQEQRVTVGRKTRQLPLPFFVLATQNPIEMEGTYPLPEAQLDRFLFKVHVHYPTTDELVEIARRTTGADMPSAASVASGSQVVAMQRLVRQVPVVDEIYHYAAEMVEVTHPHNSQAPPEVKRNVRVGASPRGLQALILAAKAQALMDGRKAVAIEDIHRVANPALRHRLILNFEAQAEGVAADSILDAVRQAVKIP